MKVNPNDPAFPVKKRVYDTELGGFVDDPCFGTPMRLQIAAQIAACMEANAGAGRPSFHEVAKAALQLTDELISQYNESV